jgi:MFS family permease
MHDGADSVLKSAISKVKRHVLPLFVIMFIVNYIDRVNIGFVRAHMEHDLGIGAAAYGLGAGLFFIGYALFEVPSNILLQKVGARIWLTRIMLTWGLVAACMAFIQNETHFYILRFLLGVAEAGFFPGVIYYFTRWLPGVERGKAIAIFLSGSAIASLISGPLSGLLLQISGFGMHGWQWMYLLKGCSRSGCACSSGSGSTPNPTTPNGSAAKNRTHWSRPSTTNNWPEKPRRRSNRRWASCSRIARSSCSA